MKTRWMMIAGLVGLCGMAQADFVTIGHPGNARNTDGYGAVAYTYNIGKYAVTIAQMRASGAGNGDEDFWNTGGRRLGTNAPAVNVSLYEAMKYCNWLTSGDTKNGAYKFSDGVYESTDRASAIAAYGKVYALPTEDEWYKAAYFKPDGSGYSRYANGTGTVPAKSTDGLSGWNYSNAATNWTAITSPWTVEKGTAEQNGTFNMMGNVNEFMVTTTNATVFRGGRYNAGEAYAQSGRRDSIADTSKYYIGFRVVEIIPEPAIEKNK